MHFDKAFVIGMPEKGKERLDRFFISAEKAGVDVELFNAVNGLEVNAEEMHEKGYLADDFKLKMPGSLGTLLSHVTLWEKIEQDSDVEIALVCEDDAVFSRKFLQKLADIPWDKIPENWDMIRLACHKITGNPVNEYLLDPTGMKGHGINAGIFCYLVKSASVPKLKNILIPYNNVQSIDVLLRNNSDKYNPYVFRKPLAKESRYRYSVRKDMNLNYKTDKKFKKFYTNLTKKIFR